MTSLGIGTSTHPKIQLKALNLICFSHQSFFLWLDNLKERLSDDRTKKTKNFDVSPWRKAQLSNGAKDNFSASRRSLKTTTINQTKQPFLSFFLRNLVATVAMVPAQFKSSSFSCQLLQQNRGVTIISAPFLGGGVYDDKDDDSSTHTQRWVCFQPSGLFPPRFVLEGRLEDQLFEVFLLTRKK